MTSVSNQPTRTHAKPTIGQGPQTKADQFLAKAMTFVGQPYRWGGGHGPGTFSKPGPVDCSGLVSQAARMAGLNLDGTAASQQRMGKPVAMKDLQPGDLVFRGQPAHHVGIYIGDGKVLHAPKTGDNVKVSSLDGWTSARRVFDQAGQPVDTRGVPAHGPADPGQAAGPGATAAPALPREQLNLAGNGRPSAFQLPLMQSEEEREELAQARAAGAGGGIPAAAPAAGGGGHAGGGRGAAAAGGHSGLATVNSTDAGNFEGLLQKLEAAGVSREYLQQLSEQYGVPLKMILAVIQQESGGNPSARSGAGAQGLMQLMPDTARGLGVANAMDPKQNVEGGVKYLSQMLKMFDGDTTKALAAYNAGPGNVQRHGGVPPFAETRNYVRHITAMMGNAGDTAQA